jgi:hypothetical protein
MDSAIAPVDTNPLRTPPHGGDGTYLYRIVQENIETFFALVPRDDAYRDVAQRMAISRSGASTLADMVIIGAPVAQCEVQPRRFLASAGVPC